MELEGAAKNHQGMSQFDSIMNQTFGNNVVLLSYYGLVQMCVFGLEYEYIPGKYKIKAECERGIITIEVINEKGLKFYPSMIYPESRYYHFEDRKRDVMQLIELTYKAIINDEIVFMDEKERQKFLSLIKFEMR
ncbi:MAG: hypothetical protein J6K26_00695 [Lachnospiraceae bacterium]|nr:hypothetical protein [Lachnospiraceae bacterium]